MPNYKLLKCARQIFYLQIILCCNKYALLFLELNIKDILRYCLIVSNFLKILNVTVFFTFVRVYYFTRWTLFTDYNKKIILLDFNVGNDVDLCDLNVCQKTFKYTFKQKTFKKHSSVKMSGKFTTRQLSHIRKKLLR